MIIRRWLTCLAILYVIACILPAYADTPGIVCLIYIHVVMFHPAWWANPLFFAGWIALSGGNIRVACVLGFIASALALIFFVYIHPVQPKVGAYFWIGSMFGLAASGMIREPVKSYKPVLELLAEPPY